MTNPETALTVAAAIIVGLAMVLVGVRVYADPKLPDDWRTKLTPIGIALVVFAAGIETMVAWRMIR